MLRRLVLRKNSNMEQHLRIVEAEIVKATALLPQPMQDEILAISKW